jgi:alpha-L-fucosidase
VPGDGTRRGGKPASRTARRESRTLSFDQNWKSAEEVIRLKNHLNSRGINYLLNVGPDYLGRIPAPSQEILRKVGEALRA